MNLKLSAFFAAVVISCSIVVMDSILCLHTPALRLFPVARFFCVGGLSLLLWVPVVIATLAAAQAERKEGGR